MSRGIGTIQQAVLKVVDANPSGLTAHTIATHLHGAKPTRAQIEAVRRAIRTLHARGLVERAIRRDNRPRNAKHDPAWLNDLAAAEASGFIHATASADRIVDEKPNTVDQCHRRLQFVSPRQPD